MKLSELKKNSKAILENIDNSELSLILLERGFFKGVEIELVYTDAFNDVKAFSISGCLFALRKSESNLINVRLVE